MNIECTNQISEFFDSVVSQILYLRNVYPTEDFVNEQKFGLTLLQATNSDLKSYLNKLMVQVKRWVDQNVLSMLVLVISDIETGETYERWTFCIENHEETQSNKPSNSALSHSSHVNEREGSLSNLSSMSNSELKDRNLRKHQPSTLMQIQTVMKQIISSVSFLPQLPSRSITFNVLAYTDKNATVPATWMDSDPRIIKNPQIVKLTPFSTQHQSVQSMVAYKILEEDHR